MEDESQERDRDLDRQVLQESCDVECEIPCISLKASLFISKYCWSGVTVRIVSTEDTEAIELQRLSSGGEGGGEGSGDDGNSSGVGTRPIGSTT